jgi:tRNA (guanine37-N1)-methyltransferase
MDFDIVTLFPGMFGGILSESIVRIAIEKGLIRVRLVDLREYAHDRRRTVDDRPYGGGPGMVLKPEPIVEAVENCLERWPRSAPPRVILLAPQGRRLTQDVARSLALGPGCILLCGRYEGVDDRVRTLLPVEELSLGDFVLSGGEVAAMAVLDATVRLVPGVLGNARSLEQESFNEKEVPFEYPQYTRPPEYRGLGVPPVLLSGDHEKIRDWRRKQAMARVDRPESNGGDVKCPKVSGVFDDSSAA